MRRVLTPTLAAALALGGCSLYAPELADCALACSADGGCPQGLACRDGLCRPLGATSVCECTAGQVRPCGSTVGECRAGQQACGNDGTWGACTGGVGPTEEVCDGRDNDCDGLIDYVPAQLLVEDRAPYTEYTTRLFGTDAGYALVHSTFMADGGEAFQVRRFDSRFNPLGSPVVFREGPYVRVVAAALGKAVVVAHFVEGDSVQVTLLPPAGPPVSLATLPQAHYDQHLQVAPGPSTVRVGWITLDTTLRLADVPYDGGAPVVFDLTPLRRTGSIDAYNLSRDGRYSAYLLSDTVNGDAGTWSVLEDNTTRQVLRTDVDPTLLTTRGARQPFLVRDGQLPFVVDWRDDINTGLYFFYDLLTSNDGAEVLPKGDTLRWGESDVIFDQNQDLLAVISDTKQQTLVLARIHGTSFLDLETVTRSLPDNSGFGPPSLALSNDEMVGVVWNTARGIMGRRVCPPFIGP
jgi:hypothetical protein